MSVITLNVNEAKRTLSASDISAFVINDKNVDVVRFALLTGFADIALDEHSALRVMYQRPGETKVRAQTLTYYDTDGLHNYYDWQLAQSDLAKNGSLTVALCILRTDSEVEEWHTTPCQIRVLDTIHTDDSDEGDETITPTVAQRVSVLETMIQRVASGAPIVVASTSAMTDTDQIYVLSTDRKWYYHNGTAWVAGGEYGAVSTDTTLTQSGMPADAKKTGDEIADLKSAFDDKVNRRYGEGYSPNLIESDASMTVGAVAKNGTLYTYDTMAYTDYIPVSPGDLLRAYCTKQGVYAQKSLRFVCCYDQNKQPISSAGTNTAVSTFTVPDGTAFVRITFDGVATTGSTATSNYMLAINCTPTEYTAYTPLKAAITEDFLTQESEAFLSGLMQNGISSNNITNKYGCALPRTKLYQTIGLPEKWYNDSMVTPPTTNIIASAGSQYTSRSNDGISFLNTTELTSSNGYSWWLYDVFYALIKSSTGNARYGWPRCYIAEDLSDCSLLAIGDSTVDHDTMTATLLSHFAEQGHTLTLLGTLGDGSGTNKNEGRAGWRAQDYLTDRQYQGVTNPFYNPTAQTFDFAYYMSNQGYTGVDFVVLQLGINDLYNYDDTKIGPTWAAMETIIDSILAYNSGIKIILNLPTTPNSDQAKLNVAEFLYRNRIIRYNEYAMSQSLAKYGTTKVRCSYCHLILDSHTEIRDNVHPTVSGYQKMALEVINQINCWQNGA